MTKGSQRRRVIPLHGVRSEDPERHIPPFADLLWANMDALWRTARQLVEAPDEPEDIVQEAVARAFGAYASVRDGTKARAWLFQILRRSALDARRKRRRMVEVEDTDVEHVIALAASAGDFETRAHSRQDLEAALVALEPSFREVVWLVDAEGFSIKEVAEVIQAPIGTVASRLYRARQGVRRTLAEGGTR